MKLHIGVVNQAYPRRRRGRVVRRKVGAQVVTTVEVAESLEERYHIIEYFLHMERRHILEDMAELQGIQVAHALSGTDPPKRRFNVVERRITERFRNFILSRQLDGITPWVPTRAAMEGINHRLPHPYAKGNPERPSFVDTGLYLNSIKAWIEK